MKLIILLLQSTHNKKEKDLWHEQKVLLKYIWNFLRELSVSLPCTCTCAVCYKSWADSHMRKFS